MKNSLCKKKRGCVELLFYVSWPFVLPVDIQSVCVSWELFCKDLVLSSFGEAALYNSLCNNWEINRNTVFTLQSNMPGICACVYLIDQHFVALKEKLFDLSFVTHPQPRQWSHSNE